MDLPSLQRDATDGHTSNRVNARRLLSPFVLLALVASLVVIAISATQPASAQSTAVIVPNVSTTTPYIGPGVVLSGTASSPDSIADVTVTVQNTVTLQYVQSPDGLLGLAPVALDAFTGLLPPPGDMAVSWRVPLQLVDGDYAISITATDSTAATTVEGPIAFSVQQTTATPDVELIAQDASWQYYDLGQTPPEAAGVIWYGTAYDATTWPSGPAQLGFGDGETTTISSIDADGDRLITAYFRHDFSIADPAAFDEVAVTMLRDDGAVIYVNGQQWTRTNMKDVGPIRYSNLAKSDSNEVVTGSIDPNLFVVGQNNISVEVHQVQASSTDLSFWLSLVGKSGEVPALESDARPGSYVLSVGDIARCGHDGDELVAGQMTELLDTDAGVFIGLGDMAYNSGSLSEFENCYEPSFGQFKGMTWPSPGNHEHYTTPNAAGYRDYFGEAAGPLAGPAGGLWYSFDIDEFWHVIALDSDCRGVEVLPGAFNGDGCAVGSEQEIWLRADLAANADKNILAFFHHPPYTNNHYTDHDYTWPLWQALTEFGADITLHGHEHHYERYTPMNVWGEPDPQYGAREFIIGSGGTYPRYDVRSPDARSEFKGTFPQGSFDYGVLQLWLRSDGYDWKWEPIRGLAPTDEGTSGLAEPFPKGVVSGVVGSSDGSGPVAGINVCAVAARDNLETCTVTAATGAFSLDPVFTDDYTITYSDPSGAHIEQSEAVTLPATGYTAAVTLERLRFMSGRVTIDGLGDPLVGGQVCSTPAPVDGSGCATVGADGNWQLQGLAPGTYEVEFSAPGFKTECYFDSEGCVSPAPITVLASADRTGINAGLLRQTGDVNCDNVLNILDAFAMAQFSVQLREDNGPCPLTDVGTKIYLGNGDANLDGVHNIADAYRLAECAVGLTSEFCP